MISNLVKGLKLNLLQVFALLAEEYQKCILVDDQDRSPNRDGYDMSWLHDQTMNVLVQLACHPGQDSVRFSRDLASGVRIKVDEIMLKAHSTSYLEYHIREMLENKPRSNWMADELYYFPSFDEKDSVLLQLQRDTLDTSHNGREQREVDPYSLQFLRN